MVKVRYAALLAGVAVSTCAWAADTPSAADLAARFGKRALVQDISLSPDGKHAAFVAPDDGHGTVAAVIDLSTGAVKGIAKADGEPLKIIRCGWASNDRIVCQEYGIEVSGGDRVPLTRTIAVNADGTKATYIGRRPGSEALRPTLYDGRVIDWLSGDKPTVLMTRDYVPEQQTGHIVAQTRDGLGVDLVDTMTGKGETVETPARGADEFITDGQGHVRIIGVEQHAGTDMLTGTTTYLYRTADSRAWKPFSKWREQSTEFNPLAVDGTRNVAFASKPLNGRDALYSVALDGSLKADLVSSDPKVDVNDVVTVGRHGRVIGATYVTDRRQIDYFDPEYKTLAASLARALPKTPLIEISGASADEQKLLVFASSDTDAGRYYLLDRQTKHMAEVIGARPDLAGLTLSPAKLITYKASDGTDVPAYLTLPPGGATTNLPAIVMPHGGPEYRDEWGFDWLPQFFAQRGFAVIQPEFRGSTGYGSDWFAKNGYKSWRLAIGDVCDAGRWLVKQGIAAPSKLAIIGWSYGGYAALQSNVLDPDLFKAVVAVAPVTDFDMHKAEWSGWTNAQIEAERMGSEQNAQEGSPARHADRFKAPVLMFHGDHDMNVGVGESKAMDGALRRAGKPSTFVLFPKLDHQLDDSAVRAKMLAQSDAFLRTSMGM